jgi:hypothetical protein
MTGMKNLFTGILALLFIAGCATNRIDWNSRIGAYTYDQAIMELGVPDRSATLSDGTIVAEWLRMRGGAYGTVHRFGYSRFESYDVNTMPDSFLRLVFGPDKRLVRSETFAR